MKKKTEKKTVFTKYFCFSGKEHGELYDFETSATGIFGPVILSGFLSKCKVCEIMKLL